MAVVLTVIFLSVAPVAPATAISQAEYSSSDGVATTPPPPTPPNGTDGNRTGQRNYWYGQGGDAVAQTVGTVTAAVVTDGVTPDRLAILRNRTHAVELVYQDTVQVRTERSTFSELRNLSWVRSVREAARGSPNAVSEGLGAVNADRLHDLGVTGEDVIVGVIDLGFNVSNPEIADNIAGSKSFTGSLTGRNPDHGTAVAEIVLDVAPNVTLYVTTISTDVEFASAVDWLESKDVDVITTSVGWDGVAQGGNHLTAEAASDAASNGTVFTSSAGNEAQQHWEGNYTDTDADNWHHFSDGMEFNALANGAEITGEIDIRLSWDAWPTTRIDYDLHLINSAGTIVASSEANQFDNPQSPTERITGEIITEDVYYVGIWEYYGPSDPVVELWTQNFDLSVTVANGSIGPPATGVNVTGVGAFQYDTDQVESFSSRGPTLDGRDGIDFVAPDGVTTTVYGTEGFFGTSAAAPHAAGVAALLRADNESFTRADLVRTLEATAIDMETTGFDYAAGHGRIDAQAALRAANPHLERFSMNRTSVVGSGSVHVTATVVNTPAEAGSQTVNLIIDGNVVASKAVSIDGRSSVAVTFDHPFSERGEHTVSVGYLDRKTVTVQEPANLTVAGYSVSPTKPILNESVTVTATVENTGDVAGNQTVTFYADGAAFATRNVSLAAGNSATTSAKTTFATSGDHTLTVADEPSTAVSVLRPANLSVVGYTVTPSEPEVNATVTISGTVENTGDVSGNTTVTFYADGEPFELHEITVAGGETATINATTSFATNGTHTVRVTDKPNTTLTVIQPSLPPVTGDNEPTDPDSDGQYEDLNGDGEFTISDVQLLFAERTSAAITEHPSAYDFTGDGAFGIADVQQLFVEFVTD